MRLVSRPLVTLLFLPLLLSTCKQTGSIADVLLVASVEVTPATATLNPLETLQLQAIPRTEGGLELPSRDVTWSSEAATRVSVSSDGQVTALAAGGPVTITATIQGKQGTAAITVIGTAGELSFTRQPSGSVQSGVPFPIQPIVLVKDTRGNPIGGILVSAGIASGGGTLGGSLSVTSAANGLATFGNLSISGVIGTRRLSFSAGTPSVTSGNLNVSAGPASQLSITTQPGATAVANFNIAPQPVIQLRDASGNAVSQSGIVVTAAINAGTGGASLGGTTSVTTNAGGSASFSNLKLTKSGNYSLKFNAAGLTQAISNVIAVI